MTAQNLTSKKSYFGSYIRYRIFKNKNLLILSFVFSAMYMLLFTGCMVFCTGFVNDFINSGAITEEGVSKTMGTVDVVKTRNYPGNIGCGAFHTDNCGIKRNVQLQPEKM